MKILLLKEYIKENYLLVLGMGVLIALSLVHIGERVEMPYIGDEFGYWSNAAYLAGYDWSNLTSQIGYYSFGYSIILSPLFLIYKICGDMLSVYRCALILNIFWWIGSYILLYRIAGLIDKNSGDIFRVVVALTASLYVSNTVQVYFSWPELFLYFLFCLLVYILVLYIEKPEKRYIIFILLISIYMYMVHQRALSVVFAAIVCIVVNACLEQKRIIKTVIMILAIFAVGIILSKYIKNFFIIENWNSSINVAANDYSGQVNKIKLMFSLDGLVKFIFSMASKLYYLLISTFGLIVIPIVTSVNDIFKFIVSVFKKQKCQKKILEIFLVLTFVGSLFISAVYMIWPSGNSHIVYGRYNEYILGPFILIAFIKLRSLKERKLCTKLLLYIIPFIFICSKIVLYFQKTVKTSGQAEINNIGIAYWVTDTEINTSVPFSYTCTIIFIGIVLIHIYMNNCKEILFYMVICCCIWIYIGDVAYSRFLSNNFYRERTVQVVGVAEHIINNCKRGNSREIRISMLNEDMIFTKLGMQFIIPEAKITNLNSKTNKKEKMESYIAVPLECNIEVLKNSIYTDEYYKLFYKKELN